MKEVVVLTKYTFLAQGSNVRRGPRYLSLQSSTTMYYTPSHWTAL